MSNPALQLVANFNLLRLISCCKLMPFDSSERIKKKNVHFQDIQPHNGDHEIPKEEEFN